MIKLGFQLNKNGKICRVSKLSKMEITVSLEGNKKTLRIGEVKLDFDALINAVNLYYDQAFFTDQIEGERNLFIRCLNKARKMYGQQH